MDLKINTKINTSGVRSYNVGSSSARNSGVSNNNLNNYQEIDYSDAALTKTTAYGNNVNCKATSINKNTTTRSAKITLMAQTSAGEEEGSHTIAGEFVKGSGSVGTNKYSTTPTVATNNTSIRVNTLKSGNKINNYK